MFGSQRSENVELNSRASNEKERLQEQHRLLKIHQGIAEVGQAGSLDVNYRKHFFQNLCHQCSTFIFFLEKSFAMSHQLVLAVIIVLILITILIILGNTLVLLVTWRERSLHQPHKYFIACLAVADLLVGIFIGPAWVYALSGGYGSLRNIHLCRFMVWIDTLVLTASIFSLMFISYDRYLKISKPLQYRSRMTTSESPESQRNH